VIVVGYSENIFAFLVQPMSLVVGPVPTVEGINDAKVPTLPSSSESTPVISEWPLFTARSRGLFGKLFQENEPVDGLLDGGSLRCRV
jgi:hypothetical protein